MATNNTRTAGVYDGANEPNAIPAAEINIDIKKELLLADKYNPMDTPLLTMLAARDRIRTVDTPEFKMMVETEIPRSLHVKDVDPAGTNVNEVELFAGESQYVRPYDIITVKSTYENAMVTAVDNSTDRIILSKAAAADLGLQDDPTPGADPSGDEDILFIIGSASADATDMRISITNDLSFDTNYVQIIKDGISIGEQLLNTKTYEGNPLKRYKRASIRQHKEGINYCAWFGQKDINPFNRVNGETVRTMDGIHNLMRNASPVSGGALTSLAYGPSYVNTVLIESELDTFIRNIFRRGGTRKTLFGCSEIISDIHTMIKNTNAVGATQTRYSIGERTKRFGLHIQELYSPFGILELIYEKNFDYVYRGAKVLDLGLINFCKQVNLGTKIHPNVHNKSFAGKKDEIRSYVSMELGVPEAHGEIVKG